MARSGRVAKKRVEARTTEIDSTELNRLIQQAPASPAPVEPDSDVELVYSDAPVVTRVAPPRLAQTLRAGVMTPVGGVQLPARPIAEGSGGLPPAPPAPLIAQPPIEPSPPVHPDPAPVPDPELVVATPPEDLVVEIAPTKAKPNVLAITLLSLLILAAFGALVLQLMHT